MEGSFADAANNHGFKRARWRRLWRQAIQDHLIAAIQNIRIFLSRTVLKPADSAALAVARVIALKAAARWRCAKFRRIISEARISVESKLTAALGSS